MTDKLKDTTYIVIHENIQKSWVRDASTWALAFGLIIPGWFMGSSAMQWIGFFIFIASTFVRSSGLAKRLTASEARIEIDRIESNMRGAE